ncbi:MAG: sigma 54-interacting transcriptional regulator [Planctomycetota bacterium]|nr:sigma 54-interacting transcriptional regulator [Planctomycetota bacterium]
MRRLELLEGRCDPDRLDLEANILLGRHEACDLRLFDETTSRRHARIEVASDVVTLEDLKSSNGTWLNGERVDGPARLFDGDVIRIGDTQLRYLSGDGSDRITVVEGQANDDVQAALDPDAADPAVEAAGEGAIRRLRFVCDGAVACADAAEIPAMLGDLLGLMVEAFAPERALVCLRGAGGAIEVAAAHPEAATPPASSTLRQRVLEGGEAVLIRDAHDPEAGAGGKSMVRSRYRSMLAAPLKVAEGVLGFVSVEAESPDAYTEGDLRALAAAARQAALALRNLRALLGAREEVRRLQAVTTGEAPPFLGEHESVEAVRTLIRKAAAADSPVLITGETGTGKELVARHLHAESTRATRPFVALNCAALVEGLLESEFFGHEKGAFTGATDRREGRIAQAADGTLFLDEVGELPAQLQAKLLRVLSEGTFRRVGGKEMLPMRCRVLAATNRDLRKMVKDGTFREDLFYRLQVLELDVPPLRERTGDVIVIAEASLERLAAQLGRRVPRLAEDARAVLQAYPWPGNVRELLNVLERALVLLEGDTITASDLPQEIRERRVHDEDAPQVPSEVMTIREAEKRAVKAALEHTGGKKGAAAAVLGISWPTLNRKIREYGL